MKLNKETSCNFSQVRERIFKVNKLLKQELGKILFREIQFPLNVLVTLTKVEAFPNLQQAKVYISVIPEGKTKEVLALLQKQIYDIQQLLNKRLRMRPVPKVQWVEDKEDARVQRVEELLDELKK